MKMVINEYHLGGIQLRQSINALLERHLKEYIHGQSGHGICGKMNFTSEDQTGHNGSIKWTFAHGMESIFKTISAPMGEKPYRIR